MRKKERALQFIAILEQLYPNAVCSLTYTHPYELLIATRLSAQCTDARVNIVTEQLFKRFLSIDDFADADIAEVEQYVKSCGLYKTKAKDIVLMCRMLRDHYNYELPDTIDELTKLPGIGRKTANLIVGDIYHKPAIVTDTHCIRICGRIGLTTSKDPLKTENELRKILPPEKSNDFCHRLVLFGRDVCKARNPECESCMAKDICKAYQASK